MFSEDDDELMNLLCSIDPTQASDTHSQASGQIIYRSGGGANEPAVQF